MIQVYREMAPVMKISSFIYNAKLSIYKIYQLSTNISRITVVLKK